MVFEYRTQPLKALFLLYSAASILLVRLPYWLLASAHPALRPRRSWSLAHAIIVRAISAFVDVAFATGIGVSPPFDAEHATKLGCVWLDPVSDAEIAGSGDLEVREGMRINEVGPEKVAAYWIEAAPGQSARKAAPGERIMLYLHGGGYVMGSAAPNTNAGRAAHRFLQACATSSISRTLAPEYRLCGGPPLRARGTNAFPAALLDALAAYGYLVRDLGFAPRDVVVCGDSAGAHLAIDLVLYLIRSAHADLPVPGGLLLISPTVDWALTHGARPDDSMARNWASDYVRTIMTCGYSARSLAGGLARDTLRTSVYLSPASLHLEEAAMESFAAFPPTCIVAGDAETTLDPMRTLRDRLVERGVRVRYHEYRDAFHDAVVLGKIAEPWAATTVEDIANWVLTDV